MTHSAAINVYSIITQNTVRVKQAIDCLSELVTFFEYM